MKKRTILATLITIIVMFATNKIWLVCNPMPVKLDVIGNGKIRIKAILNKKDDNKFEKTKEEDILINLQEKTDVLIPVERSKFPKRLRLDFFNLQVGQPYIIKNIYVNDFKIKHTTKLLEIGKATIKTINDDKIVLIPSSTHVILTYQDTIKPKSTIIFDYKVFIILLILTYLLVYKLLDYIAVFNTIENKSRIEICFLTCFFILLILPIIHINHDEKSEQENRNLAKFQHLFKENYKINFNFGKDFNEWFNDRFNMRLAYINCNNFIKLNLAKNIYVQNSKYYNKKTMWAFDTEWSLDKDLNSEFISYQKNIEKLNQFCRKNNIKLYVLIAPTKAEVYTKESAECFKFLKSKTIVRNGDNFARYMNNKGYNFVLSPLNDLVAHKDKYTYPKGVVHWGEYGGYIAYQALMKKISKDFKNIKILNENDFDIEMSKGTQTDYINYGYFGNMYVSMNIPERKLDTWYKNFTYKKKSEVIRYVLDNNVPEEVSYSQASNNNSLYIIGNSYEECISEFLFPTFKKVIKRRYNTIGDGKLSMKRYEKDILKEKPDILLLIVTSIGIDGFGELY